MSALVHEKVWVDKRLYDDAERQFYETQAKIASHSPPVVVSNKKNKQKSMAPAQNIGNVANAQCSPKKSKKNKKSKNRTVSEKDGDNKSSSEREKEVSVEKCVEADKASEKQSSPQRDLCASNNAKNKEHSDKKPAKQQKVAETRIIDNVERDSGTPKGGVNQPSGQCSLASEVAKARQHIKNSLECMDSVAALAGVPNVDLLNKINSLEKENKDLKKGMEDLRKTLQELKINFETFTSKFAGAQAPEQAAKPAPAVVAAPPKEDSDDGVDLFGSDDEEESAEAARVREERLAAYNAKKSKKPVLIAKSNIILDVKPWDDETDMAAMEAAVRGVATEGLLWGAAKLVPLAYGIHKLQISCVVEDDKVSIDWLQEELEKLEDYVQSVDIAAFNKV